MGGRRPQTGTSGCGTRCKGAALERAMRSRVVVEVESRWCGGAWRPYGVDGVLASVGTGGLVYAVEAGSTWWTWWWCVRVWRCGSGGGGRGRGMVVMAEWHVGVYVVEVAARWMNGRRS